MFQNEKEREVFLSFADKEIMIQLPILSLLLLLATPDSRAQENLDAASEEALRRTQSLMTNPGERDKMIRDNPELQAMEHNINNVAAGNGTVKNGIYDISSKVFATIVKKSNGDATKMKLLLQEAQSNPEKFYNENFSAAEQAAIRGIAQEVEKSKSPPPHPPK